MKTKLLTIKSLLVAVALCVGQSAWAETTTYNFEDSNVRFTAYNSSKITVDIAENSGPNSNSKAVSFAYKAKGAHNFAYLDFSGLVENASSVNVTFDFYVTSASGHDLISLSDADYHTGANAGFNSGSNTGYGATGAIFNLGVYRQSGSNHFAINSAQKSALTSTCLGQWCHADITVDNVSKKVAYTITRCDGTTLDAAATGANVSFLNASAYKCTQIDVYMGATSTDAPIYIDNLTITPTVIATNHSYTINAVSGGTTLKTLAYGIVAEGSNYSVSGLPEVVSYNGQYYVLSDANVTNHTTQTYTMGSSNETNEIAYTLDEKIVFFIEGESCGGTNEANANYSGGLHCTMLSKKTTLISIAEAGVYSVNAFITDRAGTGEFKVYDSDGTTEITNLARNGVTGSRTTSKFFRSASSSINVGYTGGNSMSFDYIIVRKEYAVTEIVGATDYTTNYFSAWNTTPVWINAGETGYYKFVNLNNTSSANLYENWYLFGATEASENIVIFGPNHSNTATKSVYNSKPTFTMADLNGATVELYTTLTAAADGTYTLVTTAITTKADGTKLSPNLVYTQTGLPVSKLKLYISPEKNYLGLVESASNVAIPANFAVTGTIASSGYSSLASGYGLDFSSATGIEAAYVVTNITKDAVTLTSVDELPANSGVILKGTAGATYSIPVKADAAYDGTNKLKAAVTATAIAANEAYILKGGKFCQVTGASTVPAGKAYLLASDIPASAPELGFIFDGGTTGINSVVARDIQNGEFYNLNGQRVSAPTKGLYIVNGKKVIVK